MRKNLLIELGCEGGSVVVIEKEVNGLTLYDLSTDENIFDESHHTNRVYTSIKDAWCALMISYPSWYKLYPCFIHEYLVDLVIAEFTKVDDLKDIYIAEEWASKLNK